MGNATGASPVNPAIFTGMQAANTVEETGTANDDAIVPLLAIMDPATGLAVTPALDSTLSAGLGTSSTDSNAIQATGGAGWLGWASTLVVLFRAGTAKVTALLGAQAALVSPTSTQLAGGTGNSYITPLNAGVTFTGSPEPCLGYSEITVAVKTDQPGTLTIQQSPDGVNWDIVDTKAITAGAGDTFGVSVRAANFQVLFANTSGSNQTYFRLQTIKVPVGTRAPRTLSALGNSKTAVQEWAVNAATVLGIAGTKDAALTALGYAEQTMVAATVYTLAQIASNASITPTGYTTVIITPETANVRLVLDNSTPSSTRGTLLQAGTSYSYTMADMTKIKVCMATASAATLHVEYCA